MTTTIRYFAPLVWQGTSSSAQVRQAAPVVWTAQNINAYFRQMQAVQWFSSPTPVSVRKVTALQWSQDNPTMSVRRVVALQWSQDAVGAKFRAMPAVTWTKLSSSGSLRQVSAFVMQKSSTKGQLRQVSAFVMQKKLSQVKTGGLTGLWALIQADAKQTILQAQLSVSAPVVDASKLNCNTYVTVAPLGALLQQYSGTTKLYYNRTDINNAFLDGTNNTWKLGTLASATTIRALISQINTQYGLTLDPTDVVDGPVAAGATKLQLVADPNSYVFAPGTNVWLANTAALSSAIRQFNLPGFSDAAGNGPTPAATTLLMHFDSSMQDELGHTVTALGTASLGSSHAVGTRSLQLATATNDLATSLRVNDAPDLHLTSDFTIECWMQPNDTTVSRFLFGKYGLQPSGTTQVRNGLRWIGNTSTTGYFYLYGQGSNLNADTLGIITPSVTVSLGSWYHVALVRQGNTYSLFFNGVKLTPSSSSPITSMMDISAPMYIGGADGLNNGDNGFLGGIDEFRISNVARYTANFTPPVVPFVVD